MNALVPAFDASLFSIEQLDVLPSQFQAQPQAYQSFLQYQLPTLAQNLKHAVDNLRRNQERLLNEAIPDLCQMQRMEAISTLRTEEIEISVKQLTKDFPAHFKEICHLIKFGQRLQSVMQAGNQIQSCDSSIISALQGSFQVLPHMRSTLILRSMIVTAQPNAVLKKGNLFSTEVCLLLDIAEAAPTVRIRVIALSDAEKLNAGAVQCSQVSYEATIVNNQATFEKKGDTMLSQFAKQPTLKEIGTRGQPGAARKVTVTEQKFVLLYEIVSSNALRTALGYAGPIWVTSLPVVLIVHANQFCDAYGTIVWDRAFKNEEQVDWARMCWLLKVTFEHLTGAKFRKLSDDDLEYFRVKMGINKEMPMVTYQRFAKDKIAAAIKFSFWNWFYSICTLINSDLLPYWEKGCLMGFVSREYISHRLGTMSKPAFLLRFSDSQLGTISVSSFKHDGTGALKHLPFLLEAEKLEKAGSLIELLRDFDQLKTVRYFCNKDYDMKDKGFFFEDPELQCKKKVADTGVTPTGYHKIKMVMKGGNDEEDSSSDRSSSGWAIAGSPEVRSMSRSPTRSPTESMIKSPMVLSPSSYGSFPSQQNSPYTNYMSPPQSVASIPKSPAGNTNTTFSVSSPNGTHLTNSDGFSYGGNFPQSPQSYGAHTLENPTSPAGESVLDFFPDYLVDGSSGPSFQPVSPFQAGATVDDSYSIIAACITEHLNDLDVGDVDRVQNEAKKPKRS